MSNLGSAKPFLGLDIARLPDGTIALIQKTLIDSILKHFGMQDANPALTPLCHKTRLDVEMSSDPEADSAILSVHYRESYVRRYIDTTRYAYAVAVLCRYNSKPYVTHDGVLRYLKGTATIGLVLPSSLASAPTDAGVLRGCTDSDFAGDRADRKYQGGFSYERTMPR